MKMKEIKERLEGIVDTVGKNKAGRYVARRGFFYTHGFSGEQFAAKIEAALPGAKMIDCGEVWKDFRGGASVASQSHFWAEFEVQ